jgi:hypothetical protein
MYTRMVSSTLRVTQRRFKLLVTLSMILEGAGPIAIHVVVPGWI